jgi:hypothetical protein
MQARASALQSARRWSTRFWQRVARDESSASADAGIAHSAAATTTIPNRVIGTPKSTRNPVSRNAPADVAQHFCSRNPVVGPRVQPALEVR